MKHLILLALLVNAVFSSEQASEQVNPATFTVDLAKKCQVLMLHVTADRKSKKISTCASIGDKVVNLGCKREITQEDLDKMPQTQRDYMAWKHPIWCKVAVGNKEGWVQKQYFKEDVY